MAGNSHTGMNDQNFDRVNFQHNPNSVTTSPGPRPTLKDRRNSSIQNDSESGISTIQKPSFLHLGTEKFPAERKNGKGNFFFFNNNIVRSGLQPL
jgi:hypothetical protein